MHRLLWRSIAWFFALAILASSARAARGQSPFDDDEQTLHSAGLSADGPALLAVVRKHTLTAEIRKKVASAIVQLGDDSFVERENASKKLFALGRVTLSQLQEASEHRDPEIARRARLSIERIKQSPGHHLPVAVLRLLAVRKPIGTIETLLAYLPYAEDETRIEEVRKSLTVLALRDEKPEPDLLRALTDPQPLLRSTAAEALAKGGGDEGRSAVRKLLTDAAPAVRLSGALALAAIKERDSIAVLIDLLAALPVEQVGQVEDTLYQLADGSAPKTPTGMEPTERKKCRDAWAAWWKVNAKRADLNRLSAPPPLGFTFVCDNGRDCVYEIDRHGKQRWLIDNVLNPHDAWVLPGNRVLIAEYQIGRVTERDFTGKILWAKEVPGFPVSVQRLPNGNTVIALNGGAILEVDRAGKEVYTRLEVPGLLTAYRSRNGTPICTNRQAQWLIYERTGKQLKAFPTYRGSNCNGLLDLCANGHILISLGELNKVVEYDDEGKKIREVDAPQVTTATGLPNGHILVASQQGQRVYELDRAGKLVWEHKNAGHVYRARRR